MSTKTNKSISTQKIAGTLSNITRKLHLQPADLATLGVVALILTAVVLAISFILGIESNAPLWAALVLMAAGVVAVTAGLRKF